MLKKYQIVAFNQLINNTLKMVGDGNKSKSGFFKENIFCDGGVVIAIVPGMDEDNRVENSRTFRTGKGYVEKLRKGIDKKKITHRIEVTPSDLKSLERRCTYLKLVNTNISVSTFILRRLLEICERKLILTLISDSQYDPIRFDNENIGVKGYFTPVSYTDESFLTVGKELIDSMEGR